VRQRLGQTGGDEDADNSEVDAAAQHGDARLGMQRGRHGVGLAHRTVENLLDREHWL